MNDCRQFYIDGKWVSPTRVEEFSVINPAFFPQPIRAGYRQSSFVLIGLRNCEDVPKGEELHHVHFARRERRISGRVVLEAALRII